jgi:hypothetical protein
MRKIARSMRKNARNVGPWRPRLFPETGWDNHQVFPVLGIFNRFDAQNEILVPDVRWSAAPRAEVDWIDYT